MDVKLVADRFVTPLPVFNVATTGPTGLPSGGSAVTVSTAVPYSEITTTFVVGTRPPLGGIRGARGHVHGGRCGVSSGLPSAGTASRVGLSASHLVPVNSGTVGVLPLNADHNTAGLTTHGTGSTPVQVRLWERIIHLVSRLNVEGVCGSFMSVSVRTVLNAQ